MDHLLEEFFSEEAVSPQESFQRRLDCAKRLVLEGDAEIRSRRDIRTSLSRASRHSSWLADQGLISIHQEQELAMVCFFWEFGEVFDLRTVLDSFARSISLLQNLRGTFLELYLEPDYPFSKLMNEEGHGVFSLPEILMKASPLVNRYGEQDTRQKEFRNQRWEVPMVYILCGVGSELYRGTASTPKLLDTLRASLNKLSFILQSSRDAGMTLFLLDSFLLENDFEKALPGITLEFVKEKVAVKSYASLHTAAQAACISQADINARCIQLLMRSDLDDIDILGDDLLRSFSIGWYIGELEKKKDVIIKHTISQTMRAEILQPAYALHTFIEYRGMFDREYQAMKIASEMEQHQSIFGRKAVEDAYKLVVNHYFQSNMLLYGTWQSSYAQEFLRFTGKLGFEVLIQTVATLPSNFPASHYSPEERHYIATECTKSVISLLVHTLGDRKAVTEMSKYLPDYIPEFSDIERGIDWARRMMKQANPIPMSIEKEEVGPIVRAKLCSLMGRLDVQEESSESAGQEGDEESVPSMNVLEVKEAGDTEGHEITSRVEDGYDAEDSQDHSLTEDDDEPRTPGSLSGIVATLVRVKRKCASEVSSPEHPNASLQLDPGYDADSQGQTDIEEVKKTKKRKTETGYEGGESQGHSDEEEEEEEVSRGILSDKKIAGSLLPVLAETVSQRLSNLNEILHARDETPSDGMSAADELTSCHDDDIGAESSEIEGGIGPAAPINLPTSMPQPQGSVLVQYATEAQQNFLTGRLSFLNSSFATDDAVLESVSQGASVESTDLSEGGRSVTDHMSGNNPPTSVRVEPVKESNQPQIEGTQHDIHDASLMDIGSDRSQMAAHASSEGSSDDANPVSQTRDALQIEGEGNDLESVAASTLGTVTRSFQPPEMSVRKRSLTDMQDDTDNQAVNNEEAGSKLVDASSKETVLKRSRRANSSDESKAAEIFEESTESHTPQIDKNQESEDMILLPDTGLEESNFRNVHDTLLFPIREEAEGHAVEPQNDVGSQGCDNLPRYGNFDVSADSGILTKRSEGVDADILRRRQTGDQAENNQPAMLKRDRRARSGDDDLSVASSGPQGRTPRSQKSKGADKNEMPASPMSTTRRRATSGDDDHSVASSSAQDKAPLSQIKNKGTDANLEPATPMRLTRGQVARNGDEDHSVASSIAKEKPPRSQKKGKGTDANVEPATPMRLTRGRPAKSGDEDQSVASSIAQEKPPPSQRKGKGTDAKIEPSTTLPATRGRPAKSGDEDQSVASSIAQEKPPPSQRKGKGTDTNNVEPSTPIHATRGQAARNGTEDLSVASSIAQEKPPPSQIKGKGTDANVEPATPTRLTRGRAATNGDESPQGRVLRSQKKRRGTVRN